MNIVNLPKIIALIGLFYVGYKLLKYLLKYKKGYGLHVAPSGGTDPNLSKFVKPGKSRVADRNKLLGEIVFSLIAEFLLIIYLVLF